MEELKQKLIDEILEALEANPVILEAIETYARVLSIILPYCKREE
jgi:uncharacterized phage-associated protein